MNILKTYLFVIFLATSISSNCLEAGFFDNFDEKIERHMNQMRNSMRTMGKQFKHAFKNHPTTRQIALASKDGKLRITIPNIEGDIEAHLDDAQRKLTITAPELKVTIGTRQNMVGIELKEDHKIVEKEDGKESEFYSTSMSRMDQTVERELLLDQQTIEYDQDKKELVVIIPMKEEYKGKPVAINKIKTKN